jgi:5,10-methylenetetrahydrofolate reductase
VAARLDALPAFKHDADFVFAQVSYSLEELLRWREALDFAGKVYAGVMVVASPAMARKVSAENVQLAVPGAVLDRVDHDPNAGVELACELVEAVRDSQSFDGAHLVPVSKYREVALRLEQQGWRRR